MTNKCTACSAAIVDHLSVVVIRIFFMGCIFFLAWKVSLWALVVLLFSGASSFNNCKEHTYPVLENNKVESK